MAQISTRKRGNTWEYSFEIAPINGKRKRKSKSGFRTKKKNVWKPEQKQKRNMMQQVMFLKLQT